MMGDPNILNKTAYEDKKKVWLNNETKRGCGSLGKKREYV